MSRKSAYALKDRDPVFVAAWEAALRRAQGDKVEEVHAPPFSPPYGDTRTAVRQRLMRRRAPEAQRDRFLARLAARNASHAQPRELSL